MSSVPSMVPLQIVHFILRRADTGTSLITPLLPTLTFWSCPWSLYRRPQPSLVPIPPSRSITSALCPRGGRPTHLDLDDVELERHEEAERAVRPGQRVVEVAVLVIPRDAHQTAVAQHQLVRPDRLLVQADLKRRQTDAETLTCGEKGT